MSRSVDPSELGGSFFIVPRYIILIKGMSLQRLRVYEAIFQFWNKGKHAFMSNDNLMERVQVKDKGNIDKIIRFLEKKGLIVRKVINGMRYFFQPQNHLCTDIEPVDNFDNCSTTGLPSVVLQDYRGSTPVLHNISIDKEDKKISVRRARERAPTHTSFHSILDNQDLVYRFNQKFSGYDITIENLYNDCLSYCESEGKLLTIHRFRSWIQNESLSRYKKVTQVTSLSLTSEQHELVQNYKYNQEHPHLPQILLTPEQEELAYHLIKTKALNLARTISPHTQHPKTQPLVIQGGDNTSHHTASKDSQARTGIHQSKAMIDAIEAMKGLASKFRLVPKAHKNQPRRTLVMETEASKTPSISLAEYRAIEILA